MFEIVDIIHFKSLEFLYSVCVRHPCHTIRWRDNSRTTFALIHTVHWVKGKSISKRHTIFNYTDKTGVVRVPTLQILFSINKYNSLSRKGTLFIDKKDRRLTMRIMETTLQTSKMRGLRVHIAYKYYENNHSRIHLLTIITMDKRHRILK